MLVKIVLIKPQSLDFKNKDSSLQKSHFFFFDLLFDLEQQPEYTIFHHIPHVDSSFTALTGFLQRREICFIKQSRVSHFHLLHFSALKKKKEKVFHESK